MSLITVLTRFYERKIGMCVTQEKENVSQGLNLLEVTSFQSWRKDRCPWLLLLLGTTLSFPPFGGLSTVERSVGIALKYIAPKGREDLKDLSLD